MTIVPAVPAGLATESGPDLRVPRIPGGTLRRERVTALLEHAAGYRVTAVTGPPGSGKTIACAAWARAAAPSRRVAWLTLEDRKLEPDRFWARVTAAGGTSSGLIPRHRTEPDGLPAGVLGSLRALSGSMALVLDNVHELAGSSILPGLDYVIQHAPAGLRFVLCGRFIPGLRLAKLRVTGELAEIGAADLACAPGEAEAYLTGLGLRVNAAERAELLRVTEGWMAGLRLAALAAPCMSGFASLGSEPAVADYLRDELLSRQPEQVRDFLLRTSVTDRLNGELADCLTAGPGGAGILDRLYRENLLTDRVPGSSGWYRYHPVWRDMLLTELRRELPRDLPVVLGRAARWHAEQAETIPAVRYAVRAEDWAYATQAVAEAGLAPVLLGGAAELEPLLRTFPPLLRTGDPVITAALAAARLCLGDADSSAMYAQAAQQALGSAPPGIRRLVGLWLAALRVMRPDAPAGAVTECQALVLASQAGQAAGSLPEHRALGVLWLALGTAMLRGWQIGAARSALGHARQQLEAAGLAALLPHAQGWQALAEAFCGDLNTADKLVAASAATGVGCLASAQIALERDDLVLAAELLSAGDAGAADADATGGSLPGEPDVGLLRLVIQARVALAAGDVTYARGLLATARDGADLMPAVLGVLEAEVALAGGDIGRAAAALASLPESADGQELLRARLALAEGNHDSALMLATQCLEAGAGLQEAGGLTPRERITALLVVAASSRRLGAASGDVAELIEQALLAGQPHGAYRPYLDGGPAVRSVVATAVPPTSPAAAFAGRIMERFACQLPDAPGGRGEGGQALSESELAVLRLLPTYLTNQEIAASLFLSVNTVKTHLRSVYHKLGVTSRREAIAHGRRRQLL
ncbi:MAG TPA: LuxR C-terminal-related transcriptional regulator [Streptosporangiaceae bacterium]|nr:LuxR C-terminal-related transcriptional regulator [Streptosporangiaceae bacterium]